MRRHCLAVAGGTGLALLVLVSRLVANPADTYGFGSRPIAMGGAVSADTDDFTSVYYNPSGAVLGRRLKLSLGVISIHPTLRLDGEESSASSFRALVGGINAPGEIMSLPVAFGVGAQLKGDRLSRIVTFAEDDMRWVLHEDRSQQIFVAAIAAIRPLPWLALGGGLAFLASTDGVLSIRGRAAQPEFAGQTEYDSELSHEVVAELESERYPLFGATLLPDEAFRVAIVYRGQGSVVLDVDAEFDGAISLGLLDLPTYYLLESTTVQAFVPRQLVLGASYSGFERTRVGVDLVWSQWSRYSSPLSATRSQLDVDSRGLILELPELPPATELESARFRDRLTPRVGAEHMLSLGTSLRLPLRAGYAFEATPLVAGSSPNLVDASRHIMSMGFGLAGRGPAPLLFDMTLDTHLQWSSFVARSVRGPDGARHRAAGDVWVFGISLAAEF